MELNEGKRHHKSRTPSPGASSQQDEAIRQSIRTPPSPARVGPPPSPPVPTSPVAPTAPQPTGPVQLTPCQVCGRTFVPQTLQKHVKICEKTSAKKRKMFDSSRQRREGLPPSISDVTHNGTDLAQFLPKNFGLPENSPFLEKSPPPTAKVLPKPKPTVRSVIKKPTADLQRCPHCNRTFGHRAFERHVEWCADKAKILPSAPAQPTSQQADAKNRLNARTQYKAPLARGRRSSQSRDKSSNSRSASVESTRGTTPPREYGDYRQGRVRASESMSSNDCHEDASPHVPVIKSTRSSLNNLSGDANVKARQARLARDLSNTRETPNPNTTVAKNSKSSGNKLKYPIKIDRDIKNSTKLSIKKQKQLEKLETIAQKYEEKLKAMEDTKDEITGKLSSVLKKPVTDKSQIPISKKVVEKKKVSITDTSAKFNERPKVKPKETKAASTTNVPNKCDQTNANRKVPEKKPSARGKGTKQSNTSDELNKPEYNNKIGENDFFCPCVPYITKKPGLTPYEKSSKKPLVRTKTTVELLYQNPTVISGNMPDAKDITVCFDEEESISLSNVNYSEMTVNTTEMSGDEFEPSNHFLNDKEPNTERRLQAEISAETNTTDDTYKTGHNSSRSRTFTQIDDEHKLHFQKDNEYPQPDIRGDTETIREEYAESKTTYNSHSNENEFAEDFDDNYHNLSDNEFEVDETTKYNEEANTDMTALEMSRHGSGETYTKFTENPGDLEEFLSVTDKIINERDYPDEYEVNKDVVQLHTPNTNSLESIAQINQNKDETTKQTFSDTIDDLKNSLRELMESEAEATKRNKPQEISIDQSTKDICDLEHITMYGFGNTTPNVFNLNVVTEEMTIEEEVIEKEEVCETKLPSIVENNKPIRKQPCSKGKIKNIYKTNRKYKQLEKRQSATTSFVKEGSDNESISADAPPFKLPRIEAKRLNETYDPFLSAAKQMKELMSSETNIPNKLESSTKDHNRTLPILRPSRDKITASQLRQENTKTLKDSLNRTYQKTPTLQRMKSVGINDTNTFGGRCSSFRLKNTKNNTSQLNTTFTKSNKDSLSPTDKSAFNRNNAMNRSFSSYSNSSYSTPKLKDKIPKISTSMYHSFQRTTVKQPPKTDINTPSINGETNSKNCVNLDAILINDNISLNDSTYIDPRLINKNDNLPINVNNILNNPEMISSMESLLNTENLPAKFESFNTVSQMNNIVTAKENNISSSKESQLNKLNGINKMHAPIIDDLSAEYDKIMSSLEQSITSKVSIRDDDSLCEDFDLDEFMTNFDDELNKQKSDEKRICSSTTRIVKQSDIVDSNKNSNNNSSCPTPKLSHCNGNGTIPYNKSISLNFSTNNNASDPPFLSSFKRSTSLLDSIQKKNPTRNDTSKGRPKVDELENELMQSLKDFDTVYENEDQRNKNANHNSQLKGNDLKKSARMKSERQNKKLNDNLPSGNFNGNGKSCNDSAYSSLNRISPSKLSVYNSNKEVNGTEGPPASDSSNGTHRDNDIRSVSSEEFLAMERSAELDGPIMPPQEKSVKDDARNEKRQPSRSTSRQSSAWHRPELSSSGSETSIHKAARESAPRVSRFCHECGNKFPVHTAKFCIECGVRRLML